MDISFKELKTEIYEEQCSRSPSLIGDMSCISNNFSSFFLDSLNDPSEFAKYLGNAENKAQTVEEQVFGNGTTNGYWVGLSNGGGGYTSSGGVGVGICVGSSFSSAGVAGGGSGGDNSSGINGNFFCGPNSGIANSITGCDIGSGNITSQGSGTIGNSSTGVGGENSSLVISRIAHSNGISDSSNNNSNGINTCGSDITIYSENHNGGINHHHNHQQSQQQQQHHQPQQIQHHSHHNQLHHNNSNYIQNQTNQPYHEANNINSTHNLDSSFGFGKYLKQTEVSETTPPNHLIDLDNSPPNCTKIPAELENLDHDSKTLYDIHSSNESTGTSDQRTSSNTSECSDNSNQMNASKPLGKFVINENFEVHQSHKVEDGIFQHMNKLPIKKKETLKKHGVTFTGHMSVNDKSIIVDNFARFCEEYNVNDHRPFLSLNQSGMLKPEQIKFARYLGQGLPHFTLFCIYSNFKNLFCTKRFENYSKGNYNLQYILDKTKRFLTCTTADLKNLTPQMCENDELPTNNNGILKHDNLTTLERLEIYENFSVHESHRIEDGIFTHINRLSPKKQELLKQYGIQSNHTVKYYEKHLIIENFIKFCNEYYITDHRPFLDFHESGLPKMEQIKFARYLGQGLPGLTLYKIYSAFKDILALNRIEKFLNDGYNLDLILKKKKKNLFNRMTAAASKASADITKQIKIEKLGS